MYRYSCACVLSVSGVMYIYIVCVLMVSGVIGVWMVSGVMYSVC